MKSWCFGYVGFVGQQQKGHFSLQSLHYSRWSSNVWLFWLNERVCLTAWQSVYTQSRLKKYMNLKGLFWREKKLKGSFFIVLPCMIFLSPSYRNPSNSPLTALTWSFFCLRHVIKRSQTLDVHRYPIHVKQQERWQATPLAHGQIKHAWLNSSETNAPLALNIQGMSDLQKKPVNSPSPDHKTQAFPSSLKPTQTRLTDSEKDEFEL